MLQAILFLMELEDVNAIHPTTLTIQLLFAICVFLGAKNVQMGKNVKYAIQTLAIISSKMEQSVCVIQKSTTWMIVLALLAVVR